jgi:hypothetical protein
MCKKHIAIPKPYPKGATEDGNILHDVLRGMIEDAQKYQLPAEKANGTLSQRPIVGPDDKLVSGVLKEIERLSHSQALEAERLLAQRWLSRPPGRMLEEAADVKHDESSQTRRGG